MQTTAELDDPIRLPAPAPEPARPGFPLWAALVPAVGAAVLWQVTGSPTALWFAAIGPLAAVAAVLDAARVRRRHRRTVRRETASALAAARADVARRHAIERAARWRVTPDVAGYLARPAEIWRPVPGRGSVVVVGSGTAPSTIRIDGESEPARDLRREAARLDDAPVGVPLTAGIAVVGPGVAAAAVARALIAQVCLTHPPDRMRVDGAPEDEAARMPHAGGRGDLRLWAGAASAIPADADAPIVCIDAGAPPPRCAAVIRLQAADDAVLEYDGAAVPLRPEVLGRDAADAVYALMREQQAALTAPPAGPANFGDLAAAPSGGLRVALGSGVTGLATVDLVDDGPHAIVVGVTGSGKSELLVTWVAALAARFGPDRVVFLLVDFKGGRSFDPLTRLPHVTGVVTDLDESAALRAIDSLTAEVRHRERLLAEHGARDVSETDGAMPRLVVVVDEYAALTTAHPALHAVFADIAARGRALGIHLVLATQRAAGFREAVLANAPLRIALRVSDPGESRAVIGCIDAAAIPGGPSDRGTALVRGAADSEPRLLRVTRCPGEAIDEIATVTRAAGYAEVRRPWLPPLPSTVPLEQIGQPGRIVLGLADEPAEQRQRVVVLDDDAPGLVVVGRSGAGRSSILRAVASQVSPERRCWVPADPESAWDAVTALAGADPGTVVAIDDLDLLLSRLPGDHAAEVAARLERLAREARGRGIRLVCSAQRVSAAVGRIIDHIPDRAVLAAASRAEYVALGGEAQHHDVRLPPGRGRWGGSLVQFARTSAEDGVVPASPDQPVTFWPRHATGFVAPAVDRTFAALEAWRRRGTEVIELGAATPLRAGCVVWGTPDAWVGRWRGAGSDGARRQLVVDAACGPDVRLITGSRELPPYAAPGRSRAWLFDTRSERVRRVVLPGAQQT
ncbi:FtsK/SpoIIIE domain-containing protein [Microbacterium sp. NM3R9]|uniref:FtsK/SpoIIIE domain-containing protein n=1 Tax=Microbacterium thalli TaxID=3027921 RepID=UPI002365AB33|nr:FtsK/SpoIIIE domain-containing protein [Microbacterium thalli]MDN8548364.1 FtsK/SpoIIIE domain-containing protein [Microbacterium thalli]